MKHFKLSVIVPIYNVEAYLEECLNSLICQTIFEDLDIVLVNDGSPDNSRDIASKYSLTYDNVRLIDKENAGLGAARNTGMDHILSDFVTFLDSDDIVPPNAYQLLLAPFINERIHVTVGRMESFPKSRPFYWDSALAHGSRRWAGVAQMPALIHSASACNKVFRVSRIRELDLVFRENVHFEDAHFVIPMLISSPVIEVIAEPVYLYRKRVAGGSIMDSLFTKQKNYWDYIDLIEELRIFSLTIDPELVQFIDDFIVRGFQGFLLRAETYVDSSTINEFYSRAFEVLCTIKPEVIERSVHNIRHKIPYGVLLNSKTGDVLGTSHVDRSVHIAGSRPQLGRSRQKTYGKLLQSRGLTVAVESIRLKGTQFRVEGRITARGLPMSNIPHINIKVEISGKSYCGEWVQRPDRSSADGIWSGYQINIPCAAFPIGNTTLSFVLESESGFISTTALKTVAFFRNTVPLNCMEKSFVFGSNVDNQVTIDVHAMGEAPRTISHGPLAEAIIDYRNGRSLSKWRILKSLTARFVRKDIWLLGERWDSAQDNSAALFRYLSLNDSYVKPYYVVQGGTPAYQKMSRLGKVVRHGSLKHKLLLLHAKALISAFDVDSYLVPRDWEKAEFIEDLLPYLQVQRVFLQHGVTYRDVSKGLHRLVQGYGLVVTSSESERAYFATELGYGDAAVLTGMPRYDTLEHIPGSRRILFAPTWRSYLVKPSYLIRGDSEQLDGFTSSNYFTNIMRFLTNPDLANSLQENDVKFSFLPHYEVSQFFAEALRDYPYIEIVNQIEVNFQEALRSCDLFITDYSSTFFDVAYMGTSLVYYNFDQDEFEANHSSPSRFSIVNDGFGPVAPDCKTLLDMIDESIENNFVRDKIYSKRVTEFFDHFDKGSSERVALEIARVTAELG